MKKTILAIMALLMMGSAMAYAEEISELYAEFLRRDDIKFSKEEGRVLAFLRSLQYPVDEISQLELFEKDPAQFVFKNRNDDVCMGDVSVSIIRCKNAMGVTTVSYEGDSD